MQNVEFRCEKKGGKKIPTNYLRVVNFIPAKKKKGVFTALKYSLYHRHLPIECPFNYAWKRIAHKVPLFLHVLSKASPVSCELYHVRQDVGKESRHDAASSRRYSDVTDVIDDDTIFCGLASSLRPEGNYHPSRTSLRNKPISLFPTQFTCLLQTNRPASLTKTFVRHQRNMHIYTHINTEQISVAVML